MARLSAVRAGTAAPVCIQGLVVDIQARSRPELLMAEAEVAQSRTAGRAQALEGTAAAASVPVRVGAQRRLAALGASGARMLASHSGLPTGRVTATLRALVLLVPATVAREGAVVAQTRGRHRAAVPAMWREAPSGRGRANAELARGTRSRAALTE
ncbi:MAG: hypothetical protein LBK95_01195, partial [Bifidobacteriaceae bacterium]|nr:hypothetical protein [Bifidobacteriaceae bacterium]